MSVCCVQCGHCTDEVIAEMMDCKCRCHHIDDDKERPEWDWLKRR